MRGHLKEVISAPPVCDCFDLGSLASWCSDVQPSVTLTALSAGTAAVGTGSSTQGAGAPVQACIAAVVLI